MTLRYLLMAAAVAALVASSKATRRPSLDTCFGLPSASPPPLCGKGTCLYTAPKGVKSRFPGQTWGVPLNVFTARPFEVYKDPTQRSATITPAVFNYSIFTHQGDLRFRHVYTDQIDLAFDLELGFVEPFYSAVGERVFNIYVAGSGQNFTAHPSRATMGFDILKAAGTPHSPTTVVFQDIRIDTAGFHVKLERKVAEPTVSVICAWPRAQAVDAAPVPIQLPSDTGEGGAVPTPTPAGGGGETATPIPCPRRYGRGTGRRSVTR